MVEKKNSEKSSHDFKHTLNLPQTSFPIRANPEVDDQVMLERWQKEDLYEKAYHHNKGCPLFILHDGPPYANGHIHLGSSYNKILKDIITKAQRMAGNHVPVVPGWDCHGLPIELKVTKEFPGLSSEALKKQCRAYAQHWIDIQRNEFKQLGILMHWEKPYLTMNPVYEAKTLEALALCVEKGFIQKKSKTVPWCASCQTVLASAEIEYYERKDPSIYVFFALESHDKKRLFPSLAEKDIGFLIWTTTPWTLPLNRAVLIHPDTTYAVLACGDKYVLVGNDRVDALAEICEDNFSVVVRVAAKDLQGIRARHPLMPEKTTPIILDASVSLKDGTACVHCAPGCGPEDYEIGVKNNLEIYSPITSSGSYAHTIEPKTLEGVTVIDAQGWVIKELEKQGTLIAKKSIKHSYPHCWRCRSGLIFRATQQWFLNLAHDGLRQKALHAIENIISFLPDRAKNFLKATVSGRLEWCLSRQRVWGVPIPALLCKHCDYAYTSADLIRRVAAKVAEVGIEYWDKVSLQELMNTTVECPQCHRNDFVKEKDILDVWFDSGISHYAVLFNNKNLNYPADVYLEGIDQHRGWFQSSLLTSLVLEGKPCMKTIVSHGYTVDEKGHKMSKSLGNVVAPSEIIKKIGTDGLRLWAASITIGSDPIVSKILLDNVNEVYRKIRNTARFLLSNLYDFDIENDAVALDKMLLIDRYALEYLYHVNFRVRTAYNDADFTAIFHELADYCAKELSSFYLDIIKDRLYVEKADGFSRRSAQTVCWYILDTLTRLMAPVLSFTAEQISDYYQKNKQESIHLQTFSDLQDVWVLIARSHENREKYIDWYPYKAHAQEAAEKIKEFNFHMERTQQWELVHAIRSALLKAIEEQREKGVIKHSLEARIKFYIALPEKKQSLFNNFCQAIQQTDQAVDDFFKQLLVVSQCSLVTSQEGLQASSELAGVWYSVEQAQGIKCPRCWQWDTVAHQDDLCRRCATLVDKSTK